MSTQYAFGKVVTNGLIVHVDSADRNSYVTGSLTAYDLSTNFYTSSLSSSVSYSANNGGLFEFSASRASWIRLEDQSSGSATGNYTWECWFKTQPTSIVGQSTPISRGVDTFGAGWSVAIYFVSNSISAGVTTTSPGVASYVATYTTQVPTLLSSSTFYHVIGTWTAGSKVELYVNGSFVTSTSTTSTSLRTSTVGWNLGRISSTGYFMTGSIGVARVYNRVLSSAEIKQNYEAQKGRFGLK